MGDHQHRAIALNETRIPNAVAEFLVEDLPRDRAVPVHLGKDLWIRGTFPRDALERGEVEVRRKSIGNAVHRWAPWLSWRCPLGHRYSASAGNPRDDRRENVVVPGQELPPRLDAVGGVDDGDVSGGPLIADDPVRGNGADRRLGVGDRRRVE